MDSIPSPGRPLDPLRKRNLTPLQLLIIEKLEGGLTLTKIAAEWGVALPDLSKLRKGTAKPGVKNLARLLDATKLTVSQLLQ